MFDVLEQYPHQGEFDFFQVENLADKCNAPKSKSGIYVVVADDTHIIYIGYSGRMGTDGNIIHRKGGMYDRLVNGHQFGKKARKHTWPLKMKLDGFKKLTVLWYDTEKDNPCDVKRKLLTEFQEQFNGLPLWNKIL